MAASTEAVTTGSTPALPLGVEHQQVPAGSAAGRALFWYSTGISSPAARDALRAEAVAQRGPLPRSRPALGDSLLTEQQRGR